MADGKSHPCPINSAWWDTGTDYAIFQICSPDHIRLFEAFFVLDDNVPDPGSDIAMVGFGEMEVIRDSEHPDRGTISRRLVQRVGKVESVYPDGHYLLKTAFIQTSIAIFSGMSGGFVARYDPNIPPKPFGIISHAPEPQPVNDRSISGQSVAVVLRMKRKVMEDGQQSIGIELNKMGVGRRINPANAIG
jgi:hypothetical protein